MVLFAGLLWIGWNTFLSHRFEFGTLTLLESMGLVSIAYIVHSSIRFAGGNECATDAHDPSHYDILHANSGTSGSSSAQPPSISSAIPASGTSSGASTANGLGTIVEAFNDEQKKELKKSIEGIYLKTDRDVRE